MIELENPHSVSSLSTLLEAVQSEIAAGLGAVLCGWLQDRVKQIKRTFFLSLYEFLQASLAFATTVCTSVWKLDSGQG